MSPRYLLIDPTGIGLAAYPSEPLVLEGGQLVAGRSVTGSPVVGGLESRYDFSFVTTLGSRDHGRLEACLRAAYTGEVEIVVYFLWDLHHDMGAQTRKHIPGFPPTEGDGVLSYYPVIQGYLNVVGSLLGAGPKGPEYKVACQFTEGTILRP